MKRNNYESLIILALFGAAFAGLPALLASREPERITPGPSGSVRTAVRAVPQYTQYTPGPEASPLAYAAAEVPGYLPAAAGLAPQPVDYVASALAATGAYTAAQVAAANAAAGLYGYAIPETPPPPAAAPAPLPQASIDAMRLYGWTP